jgi:hypothetical protein
MTAASRICCAFLLLIAMSVAFGQRALADDCGWDDTHCRTGGDGVYVGMSEAETRALASATPPEAKRGKDSPVSYEYRTVVACPGNTPGNQLGNWCTRAATACNRIPNASGPLVNVYRRIVYDQGPPSGWLTVGTTCYTSLVPGAQQHLTIAMIREAWRHTAFARPALVIQPKGGDTLVRLKTYFAVAWPSAGFQPGEVDTADPAQMLGHTVQIKPTLVEYDYDFGNGQHSGATTSAGGGYPDGDITTAYADAGDYAPRVNVTYGGEFSVDGGAWIRIPDTLTITGPAQDLTVHTARNRLVAR